MPSLIYTGPDGQQTELPLKAGVNRIGRLDGNDILVPDETVAENHCEVIVEGGLVSVRDLGTLTGTAVNGAAVQEGPFLPGESLRVGNMEFVLAETQPSVQHFEPAEPALIPGEACRNHPASPAKWRCSKCAQQFCDTCIADGRQYGVPGVKFCPSCKSQAHKIGAAPAGGRKSPDEMTFGGEMLAAWKYPFRGDGAIIMFTGTIFFALASGAARYAFLIGGFIAVLTTGYWMAYAQKVVTASAQGDEEPPTWPDLSDMYQDVIIPFFHAAALFAVYLLPAWLTAVFLLDENPAMALVFWGLLLIALFMMPMAWLAVSMHDSVVGLSPHFVIPSILRIPGHYTVIVLELAVLVGTNTGLEMVLDQVKIPFVGPLISSFLSVYFGVVICRLLGSLYYLNRDRLRWF
jgi:hypothetical protein